MSDHAKKPDTDAELRAKSLAQWDNEGGAIKAKPRKRPRDRTKLVLDSATGKVENDWRPQLTVAQRQAHRATIKGR